MAKNDNAFTELQLLEGIYEHLSVVEELSRNMTSLSGRVRKMEERLMEPIEITNPILKIHYNQEVTRNDCIYNAAVSASDACKELDRQKKELLEIKSGVQKNGDTVSNIREYQINQKWTLKEIKDEILNVKGDIQKNKEIADRRFKVVLCLLAILMLVLLAVFVVVKF